MRKLVNLLENNRNWAEETTKQQPDFFKRLSAQQAPEYLWIGCSDSRVPANQITGLLPGDVFVHRNIANMVVHTDFNCLSVLQYAVDVLQVKHVIVCGHYRCGGVAASLEDRPHGLIDNWLRNLRDLSYRYKEELSEIADPLEKVDRLCEINVTEQVVNVCNTTVVQDAWRRGNDLTIHGWVYGIHNGLINDLDVRFSSREELENYFSSPRAVRI